MRYLRIAAFLACGLAASSPLTAVSASAETFEWSYTGPSGNNGSGTLDATYNGAAWVVDSITGTANGLAITGLDLYGGADNLVFPPDPPNVGVDRNGLGFTVTGGVAYNVYEDDGGYTPDSPYYCGAVYCLIGPGTPGTLGIGDPVVALTDFTIAGVPEPSTWALMVLGFAGLGFAGYRRAKKSGVATAG